MVALRTMSSPRISLIAAWIAILACAGLWISLDDLLPKETQNAATEPLEPGNAALAPQMMVGFKEVFMGKVVVSLLSLESVTQNKNLAGQQISALLSPTQPPVMVVCGAILLTRAEDFTQARSAMQEVITRVERDPTAAPPGFLEVAALVDQGILDVAEPAGHHELSDAQQETLEATFGWFGELLNSTGDSNPLFEASLASSAWTIAIAMGVFLSLATIAGLWGFVWLVILAVRSAGATLAKPLAEPLSTATRLPWIFAAWFALTLLLSVGVALIATRAGRLHGGLPLFLQLASMCLPLIALAIGRRRGVSWKQVCHDVGLHCGRGFWREFFYGFTVWATAIPMLIVGALIAFALSLLLSKELADAGHPLPEAIVQESTLTRIVLFFLAAVAAPIVEEIVFRGVLFRHLRDLSHTWGRGLSFVAAALGSSFVFAAIHPQGILFIPILGALAFAFCLARETRGSLISCMVAHGFHNGLIVSFVVTLSS